MPSASIPEARPKRVEVPLGIDTTCTPYLLPKEHIIRACTEVHRVCPHLRHIVSFPSQYSAPFGPSPHVVYRALERCHTIGCNFGDEKGMATRPGGRRPKPTRGNSLEIDGVSRSLQVQCKREGPTVSVGGLNGRHVRAFRRDARDTLGVGWGSLKVEGRFPIRPLQVGAPGISALNVPKLGSIMRMELRVFTIDIPGRSALIVPTVGF
ncbi:hypothetical protein EJ06DRAFT_1003 [Trichodelitschia bisporula]|uniref:Uncharacterized protein n=1 Tax=Trichodelitschia bisporula TaxID=703511 RepID=A0A6G1I9A4_9PEZI|nr:hypothetical protein EJ06DRAFT_1003 [Trichodelitschia bisporula]